MNVSDVAFIPVITAPPPPTPVLATKRHVVKERETNLTSTLNPSRKEGGTHP
jgi:hypothetical protein